MELVCWICYVSHLFVYHFSCLLNCCLQIFSFLAISFWDLKLHCLTSNAAQGIWKKMKQMLSRLPLYVCLEVYIYIHLSTHLLASSCCGNVWLQQDLCLICTQFPVPNFKGLWASCDIWTGSLSSISGLLLNLLLLGFRKLFSFSVLRDNMLFLLRQEKFCSSLLEWEKICSYCKQVYA